jgi:N-acylneuraminate cytidylyltransferase
MSPLLTVPGINEPYNAPRQILPTIYWQTGHIDAIRSIAILAGSMSGQVILPVMLDPKYTVDLDKLSDWEHAEWLVSQEGIQMVWPVEKK